jgi:hypothetical protein
VDSGALAADEGGKAGGGALRGSDERGVLQFCHGFSSVFTHSSLKLSKNERASRHWLAGLIASRVPPKD